MMTFPRLGQQYARVEGSPATSREHSPGVKMRLVHAYVHEQDSQRVNEALESIHGLGTISTYGVSLVDDL